MYYQEAIREAARRAAAAARRAIAAYDDDTVSYERGITDGLAVSLRDALNQQIEHLTWRSHVLRDTRGKGGEESKVGADLLMHVSFKTPEITYSKGLLIQAKRVEPSQQMARDEYDELIDQCNKMLGITTAAWVFDYAHGSIRCGPASAIVGSNNRYLYEQCVWTPYRFFLELFRCPIGDPRITSARVDDLPVPTKLITHASAPDARAGS
jgi:hypothetical protein